MPSITPAEYIFLRSPSYPIHPPIWFSSVLFFCPFLVALPSSSSAVVSRMTTRKAAGAYPTCPFLYSTSLQCSFYACSPLKMSVSHCYRSISFPRGLSGFLVSANFNMLPVTPSCPHTQVHALVYYYFPKLGNTLLH